MICTNFVTLTLKKPQFRLLFPMSLIILNVIKGDKDLSLPRYQRRILAVSFRMMHVFAGNTEALNLWNRQSRQRESKRNCHCQNRRMGEDRADPDLKMRDLMIAVKRLATAKQQLVGNVDAREVYRRV